LNPSSDTTFFEAALKTPSAIAISVFVLFLCINADKGQSYASETETSHVNATHLFVSADESSEIVATLNKQQRYVPLAEATGVDGGKWYLVKTDTGAVGWMKKSNEEEVKKLDSYFKPVPVELSFPKAADVTSSRAGSPSSRITVPVESNGSSLVVRVVLNGSLSANLFLDTGATRTMVSRRIARSLGLSTVGSAIMSGIGGRVVAPMARLQSVKVGEAEVSNLIVSIHDFSPDARIEGLLGLDFLNQFEVSLDARKRQVFLTPR
jgi:predicted aspartyl protease